MIQGIHKSILYYSQIRSYFFGIPSPYSLVYDGEAGVLCNAAFKCASRELAREMSHSFKPQLQHI